MTERDFITEDEICQLTGWTPKTLSNNRSRDDKFPPPCPGKIRRYPKKEFEFWYTDYTTRKRRKAS